MEAGPRDTAHSAEHVTTAGDEPDPRGGRPADDCLAEDRLAEDGRNLAEERRNGDRLGGNRLSGGLLDTERSGLADGRSAEDRRVEDGRAGGRRAEARVIEQRPAGDRLSEGSLSALPLSEDPLTAVRLSDDPLSAPRLGEEPLGGAGEDPLGGARLADDGPDEAPDGVTDDGPEPEEMYSDGPKVEVELRPQRRLRLWQLAPIVGLSAVGSLMFAFPLAFDFGDSGAVIAMLGLLICSCAAGWGMMAARRVGYTWPGLPARGSGRRPDWRVVLGYVLLVAVVVVLAVWRVARLR
jgi:hypothetical protein